MEQEKLYENPNFHIIMSKEKERGKKPLSFAYSLHPRIPAVSERPLREGNGFRISNAFLSPGKASERPPRE
jgi:hypothetical protein